MNKDTKDILSSVTARLTKGHRESTLIGNERVCPLPDRDVIIEIIRELRKVIFPGYFDNEYPEGELSDYYIGNKLSKIFSKLCEQIEIAFCYNSDDGCCRRDVSNRATEIAAGLLNELPDIQSLLYKDVEAFFDGDPAAKSREEIIFSYPGLVAIYVYRISHILYSAGVPLIPRIMSEYAHSRTGIDINSGATIGEYFFIDHGTGIVIGETTVIGNNVKIYQGVTLGGLSTRGGQALSGKKRHPTIMDNVTIYSGATILGGDTVIGENSVIGGNSFITESVPAGTKVSIKSPELIFKDSGRSKECR